MTAIKRSLAAVWLPYLLSRLWITLFIYAGHTLRPSLPKFELPYRGVSNWWLNPWTTYDSFYYIGIARKGYFGIDASAFFPGYPTLLRLAGHNENTVAAWGIFLSHAALLAGLALLYHLTEFDYDTFVAKRTVWLTAFFPSAVVFGAVYTESVFLVLIASTFLAARRERWILAGVVGLIAAFTRNSGPVTTLVLVIHYGMCLKRGSVRFRWRDALSLLLPFAGFCAVQFYFRHFLHADTLKVQQLFRREFVSPITPLITDFSLMITGRWLHPTLILNWGCAVLSLVFVVRYWKKPVVFYAVYLMVLTLLNLTFARMQPPQTSGAARYVLTTIPFLQYFALSNPAWLKHPIPRIVLTSAYVLVCGLFAFLFGTKQFLF